MLGPAVYNIASLLCFIAVPALSVTLFAYKYIIPSMPVWLCDQDCPDLVTSVPTRYYMYMQMQQMHASVNDGHVREPTLHST